MSGRRGSLPRGVPKPAISEVLAVVAGVSPDDIPTGGGWVRMHCPFHTDRIPSASVNHDINRFRCFSCDRDGDGLDLLQRELRLDFREAVDRARQLDSTTTEDRPKPRASDLLMKEFGW